ncbi:hypothetical protein LDENG_00267000 [Lucifuga dentata]|nr:hypothetical protein LDENG_00267000 [Lucifuga dentata]
MHQSTAPVETAVLPCIPLVLQPAQLGVNAASTAINRAILPRSAALHSAASPQPFPSNGPATTIHSVGSASQAFKSCSLELDGVPISLLLDTGASCSLLNLATIQHLFPHRHLDPSFESLKEIRTAPPFLPCPYDGSRSGPSLFTGLGCLTAFNHQPLLKPDVRSIIQSLCRLPLTLHKEVTVELQKLSDMGIIERVDTSPWISNLMVTKKKSRGLCPCLDLRTVNKAVIPDKYPLPTVEKLTAKFHGSTVFFKLDLSQGYLQAPLHPDSQPLTAFVTHIGVFRYTLMPFGLSSAPSCFQKIMSAIFAGIPGVMIYLDDIVVHGPTSRIHDECLEKVLNVLASHNLTLNGDKCVFSVPAVEFVAPLRELLKKDASWTWTPACSAAVHWLKAQLTSPPVLAHFDLSSLTLLICDTSNTPVGAVLSQIQHGTEHPVAFASWSLTPAEQKYSVGEWEALACIWAGECWHMYLYGCPFTLRTDHQALTTLLESSGMGHRPLRLHCWSERLYQYNFSPVYTRVREYGHRSSLPGHLQSSTSDWPRPWGESELIQMLHAPLQATVSLQELQLASEQDPVLSYLRN